MMDPKTEVIIVGDILEEGLVFKMNEVLKNMDVDVIHCEISFSTLKEGIEGKKPSTMRCYLIGPPEQRKDAVSKMEKLAKENNMGIDTVDYEKMWRKK